MKPMEIICILALVAFVVLGAIYFSQKPKQGNFSFPNHNLNIEVELAQSIAQQAKGLMNRKKLNENAGMLFVFTDEAKRSFWMKNTYIPLDLIFISKDKKIVEIKENFEPCHEDSCSTYKSENLAQYTLEVNAGFVQKNQIKIGEEVVF